MVEAPASMAEAHVERGALPQAFIDWIVELMRGMRRRYPARYHWGVMPSRWIISLTRWFSAASTFLASWRDAG